MRPEASAGSSHQTSIPELMIGQKFPQYLMESLPRGVEDGMATKGGRGQLYINVHGRRGLPRRVEKGNPRGWVAGLHSKGHGGRGHQIDGQGGDSLLMVIGGGRGLCTNGNGGVVGDPY